MNHLSGNIGQTEVASAIPVAELRMVDAQQVKDGGLQIVNVGWGDARLQLSGG